MVTDKLNRPLHDLRISIIDRCNFRCQYCMPEETHGKGHTFLEKEKWLRFDEIERLARLFLQLGVKKFRITGGEPLLRPDVVNLVQQLRALEGIDDLALTTNGSLLERYAYDLKRAGLNRLTVSLDTLDSRLFKKIVGGREDIGKVLKGIKKAQEAGFTSIKINVVVQKGVNHHTIMDLIEHFRGSEHVLRFIEYMDVGNCNHWEEKYVLPSKDILKMISAKYPLEPLEENYYGEVAERYRFIDGGGEVGFISSISQPFCSSCTRLRLSTEGKLYTCLFASEGTDIRQLLREGKHDEDILAALRDVWKKRSDRYSEIRREKREAAKKVEMYHIGG